MTTIPSGWATVAVSYGEGKKHLCTLDSASFEFHASKDDADKAIKKNLQSGDQMIALLRVDGLFSASITVVQIA